MPTNKNAQLRYQIIDKCLSNWSRRYYIEDLVDACNEALYLYNGETKDKKTSSTRRSKIH